MASAPLTQDTGHSDTVHDVQLDYYGRKLATASSDRTIRVFDVTGDQLAPLTTLQGHEGPVWQVSWSHPKFGKSSRTAAGCRSATSCNRMAVLLMIGPVVCR